jgi:hypothetical protein
MMMSKFDMGTFELSMGTKGDVKESGFESLFFGSPPNIFVFL